MLKQSIQRIGEYTNFQNKIYDIITKCIRFIWVGILPILILPKRAILVLYVILPIVIRLLTRFISHIVYNIFNVQPMSTEEIFYYILDQEVGKINKEIIYKEKYGNDISYMVYYPLANLIDVNITISRMITIPLIRDIDILLNILHEVRHIYQLEKLSLGVYESKLYNINESNKKIKNKKEYFENELEKDAYIFAWTNLKKYLHVYLKGTYKRN